MTFDSLLDYLDKNKQWLFSGIGISAIAVIFWIIRHMFLGNRNVPSQANQPKPTEVDDDDIKPNHWDTIKPLNSRYKHVSSKSDSIPAGVQTFAFEYSPTGHAHPLKLKGKFVRAEIQFSCRVSNVYSAMFEANEYGLNVLQPQFLIDARITLEKYSLTNLRNKRQEVGEEIQKQLMEKFDKYGFALLSVTIGDVEELRIIKPVKK